MTSSGKLPAYPWESFVFLQETFTLPGAIVKAQTTITHETEIRLEKCHVSDVTIGTILGKTAVFPSPSPSPYVMIGSALFHSHAESWTWQTDAQAKWE
jgi:hypothetical protein